MGSLANVADRLGKSLIVADVFAWHHSQRLILYPILFMFLQ